MPDLKGTTRAQTLFLRAFHQHPYGPPPNLWPSPAILRKWLRRPAFATAFRSIRDTLRIQADLHLTLAATQAAHALTTTLPDPVTAASPGSEPSDLRAHLTPLISLLRLAHLRQRFPSDPPLPERPPRSEDSILNALANFAPSLPLGDALEYLGLPHRTDYNAEFHERSIREHLEGRSPFDPNRVPLPDDYCRGESPYDDPDPQTSPDSDAQ